jgi:ADP-ribose pyrophosphatase
MPKKPKPWKLLSSKVILDHERLKVTEDRLRLPNGRETNYVRHAPTKDHSVAVIALNTKNQILIQQEYSYPPNKVMWQLPGGSMNAGETIKAAAKRELAEESGYSAKKATILGSFYIHNRLSDKKQYVVLCTELFKHKLPEDEDEFIESYWLSKRQVTAMITKGKLDNINLLAALNLWFHSDQKSWGKA